MCDLIIACIGLHHTLLHSLLLMLDTSELCYCEVYSRLLVTCQVTSVKLQIANYFWLTANPIIHEYSSTISYRISSHEAAKVICYLQFHTCNWTGDQQSTVPPSQRHVFVNLTAHSLEFFAWQMKFLKSCHIHNYLKVKITRQSLQWLASAT